MSNTQSQHVFVSYARANEDFAQRLVADLERAKMKIWIDRTGLTPGTPNWEQAIRDAISSAVAMILVASLDSRQSVYVQGELKVAESNKCPVYPLWAEGEDWVDCVSLSMIHTQYIDCRGSAYDNGLRAIAEILRKIIKAHAHQQAAEENEAAPNYFFVELYGLLQQPPCVAAVDPQHPSMQDMLDNFYGCHVKDLYKPRTYGSDWILASRSPQIRRLLVPWFWLGRPDSTLSLYKMNPFWATSSLPENYGLLANTYWKIVAVPSIYPFGLATNDDPLAERIRSLASAQGAATGAALEHLLLKLFMDGEYDGYQLSAVLPDAVRPNDYKYTFVLAGPWHERAGRAFVCLRQS